MLTVTVPGLPPSSVTIPVVLFEPEASNKLPVTFKLPLTDTVLALSATDVLPVLLDSIIDPTVPPYWAFKVCEVKLLPVFTASIYDEPEVLKFLFLTLIPNVFADNASMSFVLSVIAANLLPVNDTTLPKLAWVLKDGVWLNVVIWLNVAESLNVEAILNEEDVLPVTAKPLLTVVKPDALTCNEVLLVVLVVPVPTKNAVSLVRDVLSLAFHLPANKLRS